MKYKKYELKKKILEEKRKKTLKNNKPIEPPTIVIPENKGFDKYELKVTEKLNNLYSEIEKLYIVVNKALEKESINNESLIQVNNSLVILQQTLLTKGLRVEHINKLEEITKSAIKSLNDIKLPSKLKITDVGEIKKLPKWLASEESLIKINKNLGNIADQLGSLEADKPGQKPIDFMPVRRVVAAGNKLRFDDSVPTGGGGGGGNSSSTQYADGEVRGTATGTLAMVDDGTNIQSASGTSAGVLKVDLSATTANTTAIKVDGSAVTQPISGTVTVTNTDLTSLLLEMQVNNGGMAQQVDDTGSTLYQGWAEPGSATSGALWRIRRVVSSGTPTDTAITFADGNRNFDNIWDNRAALSYS